MVVQVTFLLKMNLFAFYKYSLMCELDQQDFSRGGRLIFLKRVVTRDTWRDTGTRAIFGKMLKRS